MNHLFTPLKIRSVELKNRLVMSPMQQASSEDGFANDWHLVHLGSRAVGGAGMVMTEATAISKGGRRNINSLGIWKEEQIPPLRRITDFIKQQGAVPGIQINHSGSKSKLMPLVSSSAVAPMEGLPVPRALKKSEIKQLIKAFQEAAQRADKAGFEVIEIHAAHGFLIHEFLSPLINQREDEYGGNFENRIRFLLEVIAAIRTVWKEERPLFLRISTSDYAEENPKSWKLPDSIQLAHVLKGKGIDLITASGGGFVQVDKSWIGSGYQVPFAAAIRQETGIPTGAMGLITEARQADQIIRMGEADLVVMARQLLRDPYFPIHAAKELGYPIDIPKQYQQAY